MPDRPGAAVKPRVLVFFDYACQFCYLDWPRLKRLRDEHGPELFLVPFELRPQAPPEGLPIEEVGEHSPHVEEHMERMATEFALPLVHPRRVPNTHLALVLGEYARDLGPEAHEAMHEAIFEAYSGKGLDIGDRDDHEHAAETAHVAQALKALAERPLLVDRGRVVVDRGHLRSGTGAASGALASAARPKRRDDDNGFHS